MPTLTRLLYPYYDVIQSIFETFKTKSSYDECLYWVAELYFSMYYDESFYMIYFLYFQFCIPFDKDLQLYIELQKDRKMEFFFINKIRKNEGTNS